MKRMNSQSRRPLPLGLPVGILGGGQLARMLSLAAFELGLEPWVLSSHPDDPAAQVTPNWIEGSPNKAGDITRLAKQVHALTFESEFFAMKPLKKFSSMSFPRPHLMEQLQDRRSQKQILVEHGIPTSPFICVNDKKDLQKVILQFPEGCVLKKSQGGYDGFGTFMIRTGKDLEPHFQNWQGPYIAEERIPFQRELALMFFHNAKGEFLSYPLVESRQKNSKCDLVLGPVHHRKEKDLIKKFRSLMGQLKYVGALGVELFETQEQLMVNELAPRVHNSGHYSMDAFSQSQFHLHWKAVLNLPLELPLANDQAFVMANLIGETKTSMQIPAQTQGAVHWYGKIENRPGRKMGHINYVGSNGPELLKLAIKERNRVRK